MPSEFLHTFVGIKTLKNLGLISQRNIRLNVVASQGPDVFLYTPFDMDTYVWGNILHNEDKASSFIQNLGEMLRLKYPSFAIAFASHYITDSIIHPYINARTKTNQEHGQFERAIDRAYMEFLGIYPYSFRFSNILPKHVPYEIDIAIKDSIRSLQEETKYIVGYYTVAYKYMYTYHLVYDKAPFLVEISANILSRLGITALQEGLRNRPFPDPLNIRRKPWKHKDKIHYEDVIYMVERAVEKSIEVGRAYLKGSPLEVRL